MACFLQWAQWLCHAVVKDDNAVVLNMDESAIQFAMTDCKGYSMFACSKAKKRTRAPVAMRDTRAHATLVATICNDDHVQKELPQFILTKQKTLSSAEKAELSLLEHPIEWLPDTTGWVDKGCLPTILRRLRDAVRRVRGESTVVVLAWDCATQHTTPEVLRWCARLNIHLLFVPARMTWLLQPLDTHTFANLKRAYRCEQSALRASPTWRPEDRSIWVKSLVTALLTQVTMATHGHHMQENGIMGPCHCLRLAVCENLPKCFPLPLAQPTVQELHTVMGVKRSASFHALIFSAARRRLEDMATRQRFMDLSQRLPRATRLPGSPTVARAAGSIGPGTAADIEGGGSHSATASSSTTGIRRTRSGTEF